MVPPATTVLNQEVSLSSQVRPTHNPTPLPTPINRWTSSIRRSKSPHPPSLTCTRATAKILKRIPRGARDAVAAGLQSTLNTVLERPEDPQSWVRLWSFTEGYLRQPSKRGGKRRNLTSSVLAQTSAFTSTVGLPPLTTATKRWGEAGKKARKPLDPEAASANRAAAKIDEGDVEGEQGLGLLCALNRMLSIPSPRITTIDAGVRQSWPATTDRRPPPLPHGTRQQS